MKLKQVCEQFIYGQQCRQEAKNIDRKALSAKFERSLHMINRVISGHTPEDMCDWEASLIRELEAERKRLLREVSGCTKHVLCKQYGVTEHQMDIQLQLMGWNQEPVSA